MKILITAVMGQIGHESGQINTSVSVRAIDIKTDEKIETVITEHVAELMSRRYTSDTVLSLCHSILPSDSTAS